MRPAKLVIIGGSAGSLQVILSILGGLKTAPPFAILIILHRNSSYDSSLEELIATRTPLPIKEVEEKEPVQPGIIYIGPSDYHVLFEKDRSFSLDYSERINFSRPSIDVCFRSAADVYGPELVCCLLSGGNADGVEGLEYAKDLGGMTIVQDPKTAEVPYMPQHAINTVNVDNIIAADQLPDFIGELGHR